MNNPSEILRKYWGYDSFRPLQLEIIQSILSGHDTLALMPTGGGKSICFQVPSLAREGLCLVVSPLIALMKDQVMNLKKRGIPALSIYSGMTFIEVKKTLQNAAYGNFKFLYVSPERLETDLFLEFLSSMKINLIAVDEAHCVSQWGYDFRPPYLRIATIREYFPNVPVLALTASATLEVQKDICEKLGFKKDQKSFHQSFERPNLSYSVFDLSSRQNKLISILNKIPGSGIVYCKSRKRTKEIAELLKLNGISADHYHAGLSNDERNSRQEDWINNKTRIISCTNAFGMGIDKPDVRTVIHYDVPDALENYYQEAGRAGRDEQKAYAVLFYNDLELNELKKQSAIRFPSKEMIRKVYAALCNYFQLASGCGEGVSYDFDINNFVKKFNLEAFVVNSALKILEQEELISYSEQFFSPSTIEFTVSKSDLELFEKNYPQYDEVIKGLLRFYEGIFDFPASINETQLSKFVSIKKDSLINSLNDIQRMGIITYTPQKEKPQIQFLQNRVNASDLIINEKNILKRKHAFEKRLEAMVDYTKNQMSCRSGIIANYFNDFNVRPCCICDNCIKSRKIILTNAEFNSISDSIKKIVKEDELSLIQIFQKLKDFKENKIKKVLNFLLEENLLTITQDGLIILKNQSVKNS
ncbi:MAG: RecQ family ATP-dependent DNA helicase [Bacteroidota bacterium]|nr:RecQ family ATP-dependent DNA helicase [Bacteroidota bacterium]